LACHSRTESASRPAGLTARNSRGRQREHRLAAGQKQRVPIASRHVLNLRVYLTLIGLKGKRERGKAGVDAGSRCRRDCCRLRRGPSHRYGAGIIVTDKRLGWAKREYDRGGGDESEDDPASAN
jgi:hypothetical protein